MRKNGFTLIELLVVITVIGILAGLIVANFSSARARARDIRRKSDLAQVKLALRLYYNDFQRYPTASSGRIQGCGANGTSNCTWGSAFTAASEYMKQLPLDPLNTTPYIYTYTQTNSGDGFLITSRLENASDTDSASSQAKCGVTPIATQFTTCQD